MENPSDSKQGVKRKKADQRALEETANFLRYGVAEAKKRLGLTDDVAAKLFGHFQPEKEEVLGAEGKQEKAEQQNKRSVSIQDCHGQKKKKQKNEKPEKERWVRTAERIWDEPETVRVMVDYWRDVKLPYEGKIIGKPKWVRQGRKGRRVQKHQIRGYKDREVSDHSPVCATMSLKGTDITFGSFNVNHLSKSTQKEVAAAKLDTIDDLVKQCDIVGLQETNDLPFFKKETDKLKLKNVNFVTGPIITSRQKIGRKRVESIIKDAKGKNDTGGTGFRLMGQKSTSGQNECYPIAYDKTKFQLESTTCVVVGLQPQTDRTKPPKPRMQQKTFNATDDVDWEEKFVQWERFRPIIVYKFSLLAKKGTFFNIGVIHTSPDLFIGQQASLHVWAMSQLSGNDPWQLIGDFYVKEDTVCRDPFGVSFSEFIDGEGEGKGKDLKCQVISTATDEPTNFPLKGEGMCADYFIASDHWET